MLNNEFAVIFIFGFIIPVILFVVTSYQRIIDAFKFGDRSSVDVSNLVERKDFSSTLKVNVILLVLIPTILITFGLALVAYAFRGTGLVFVATFSSALIINALNFILCEKL